MVCFRVESRRVEPGLVGISLVNDGELDISSRLTIRVRWLNARLVAGDGLRVFELVDGGPSTVNFLTRIKPCRLPAGEKQAIVTMLMAAASHGGGGVSCRPRCLLPERFCCGVQAEVQRILTLGVMNACSNLALHGHGPLWHMAQCKRQA